MDLTPLQSNLHMQSGNRHLFYRYVLLAILVLLLVSLVVISYYKQQRFEQLNDAVIELTDVRGEVEQIDHAIQNMYAAENYFRLFTLTYQNEHLNEYVAALQGVAQELDSLEGRDRKEGNLKGLLADKTRKTRVYISVRSMMDSLLKISKEWDTTKQLVLAQPVTAGTFRQKIRIDSIISRNETPAPKRKKLFGRLADAISNKPQKRDTAGRQIVKTTISADNSPEAERYNQQQLRKINEYYNDAFRRISQGHARLNKKEYEMVLSNDRLLKTLLSNLNLLKQEEVDAAHRQQLALRDNISVKLEDLNSDTLYILLFIGGLSIAILVLLWYNYRTGVYLNSARHHAVRFSKLKSDFVASMSHEIRTPLSSVIGFSEQLGKTRLDGEQSEYVDAINLSANMLLSVVNNVLDFSKLEENKLTLENKPFAPAKVLEDTTKGLSIKAAEKGIQLQANCSFTKEVMVTGDAFRLRQILFNLVGNAIKFTNKGGVTINATLRPEQGRMLLDVAVTDTGIGIEKKHLPHIFEEFTQAASNSAKAEGTGLGLTIVKRIIDLHGGTVQVNSTLGKGSTFRFSIPYLPAEEQRIVITSKPQPIAVPKVSQVLLADDNTLNRRLLELILKKIKVDFRSASNGQEALELLGQHDFDIILTDIQMPVMDGLALARHIRQLNDPKKAGLPILAITGNVVKEDLDTYMAAGMNGYILKPFREQDVLEKITSFRGKEAKPV